MLLQLFDVVAPVFACAAVGWAWGRFGPAFDDATTSRLVLYVSAPCLIFHSLVTLSVSPAALTQMAALAALALASFTLLGAMTLRLLGLPRHTFLGPLVFSNSGNFGLGICLFAFGEEGLALGVAYFAVSFVTHSLVGDLLFAGKSSLRPLIASPLAWAVVVSGLVLALGLPVPLAVARSAELLGNLTIPLMLVGLGVSLARLRPGRLGPALQVSLLRFALGAGVGLALAHLAGVTGVTRGVLVLECAMPVGVLNYIFAQKYDRDPEAIAATVMVSTVFSLLAVPALLHFLLPH